MSSQVFSLADTRETLQKLQDAVTTLGRYWLLAALSAPAYDQKLAAAEAASRLIDRALELQQFAWRQYHMTRRRVSWSAPDRPDTHGILVDGEIQRPVLVNEIRSLAAAIAAHCRNSVAGWTAVPALSPACRAILDTQRLIEELHSDLGGAGHELPPVRHGGRRPEAHRALAGPIRTPIDPAFDRQYSSLRHRAPSYSDDLRDALPYYWTLSTREAMASDSCALSAIEYDGLPLEFYRDMAKQCWDEARHAVLFKAFCREAAPLLLAELPVDDPLARILEVFLASGGGLPIPAEGNFYEVMWRADLVERLILMQIETETPAVRTLAQRARGALCARLPSFKSLVEIDRNDEISHARIGHNWFRYLVPAEADRRDRRELTALLRGVLFASVLARSEGVEVSDIIATFATEAGSAMMPTGSDGIFVA